MVYAVDVRLSQVGCSTKMPKQQTTLHDSPENYTGSPPSEVPNAGGLR